MFGRDEGGSEFSFTQQQIDLLLERWSQTVRAVGVLATSKPTSDTIMVVELTISDKNKPLLLANPAFLPYLVDALLLVRPRRPSDLGLALSHLRIHDVLTHRADLYVAMIPIIRFRTQSTHGQV